MSAHTPGPLPRIDGEMPTREQFAEWLYDSYGWNIDEARDYARLIAAAPEMLEALARCVAALRDGADGQPSYFWNAGGEGYESYAKARALLAKIEGR